MRSFFLFFVFVLTGVISLLHAHESIKQEALDNVFDSLEHIKGPWGEWMKEEGINNRSYRIQIKNQEQFEQLNLLLKNALSLGEKNIVVEFKKNTYYYNERHVELLGLTFPESNIIFNGKGATLVSKGRMISDKDTLNHTVNGESCFVDLNRCSSVSPWNDMLRADSVIEIIDMANKRCRLKCSSLEGVEIPQGNHSYIAITRWCRCYQYKVEKIHDKYVYFVADDLEYTDKFRRGFNINYDYLYAEQNPRFRLCYLSTSDMSPISVEGDIVRLNSGVEKVYLCESSNFLTLDKSLFGKVTIKNLVFLGGKREGRSVFFWRNTGEMKCEISRCKFIGQNNSISESHAANYFYFHNNMVKSNYIDGIGSDLPSHDIVIVDNYFEDNGKGLSNYRCVNCFGDRCYIARNLFKNFGYCAISLGINYLEDKSFHSSSIVENNVLYYDNSYFTEAWKHSIMDSGAIYLSCQVDDAIVRYNYIFNYAGVDQNRGIFCDDGSSHFSIYGNVVMNIPSCHAIDSRRAAVVEKKYNPKSKIEKANIDNIIFYNITNGTIHFVGREEMNNGCLKGPNIMIKNRNEKIQEHRYKPEISHVKVIGNDLNLRYLTVDNYGIMVDKPTWKILRQQPIFDKIKRWVRM